MSESEEIQGVAVVHVPKGGAELAPLHYDDAERQIIRTSFLSGASDVEALALIKTAELDICFEYSFVNYLHQRIHQAT